VVQHVCALIRRHTTTHTLHHNRRENCSVFLFAILMSSSIFVRVHEWARWFEPPQGLRTSGFREHFECADPQCEVTAYNAGAVSTHFACVHKFGCPFCGVNFIAQRFLDNHLVVVHASFFPCPIQCPVKTCHRTFSSVTLCDLHVYEVHGVEPSCIVITGY
uniref:C2H2-type domain-containing protein n=1 Tax=Mesocestoides corti TaxID=53468 RepID=A0A5K3FUZ9_MESCO